MSASTLYVLTPEEILTRWRLLRGWEPLCSGAPGLSFERTPSPQLDAMLMEHIRAWYLRALTTYPVCHLPQLDFSGSAPLAQAHGITTLTIPAECLRPVSVALGSWHRPAQVFPAESPQALHQLNPFTAATPAAPVAIQAAPALLELYPAEQGCTLAALTGVPAPQADRFILTPFLIADMAKNDFIDSLDSSI